MTKPFKDSIDISSSDFINECEEKNNKLDEWDALNAELAMKDDIIYKLIEENNDNVNKAFEEVKNSTEQEISHWIDLCENYKQELNQNLKLREGLKDYIDILKEKFKLDVNLNRIVDHKDNQNQLK